MEKFHFRREGAIVPRVQLLDGVTISPLTATLAKGSPVQAAIFHIGPEGSIPRHAAAAPQIIVIIEGRGEVSGASGTLEAVEEGDAVFFAEGEEHETRTSGGMVALIVEGPGLQPARYAREE